MLVMYYYIQYAYTYDVQLHTVYISTLGTTVLYCNCNVHTVVLHVQCLLFYFVSCYCVHMYVMRWLCPIQVIRKAQN